MKNDNPVNYPEMILYLLKSISDLGPEITDKEIDRKMKSLFHGKELHELTKPLREYRKREKGKIKQENPELFHQLHLLMEIYSDISSLIGHYWNDAPQDFQDEKKYKVYAVTSLFNKSTQTVFDIISLLENGSLVPTLVLWRMIYENYIISSYLLDHSDDVSKRFNDHWIISENKLRKGKNQQLADKVEKLIEEYGSAYEDNYGWAASKETRKGKYNTFSVISKKYRDPVYSDIYSFSSDIIHSSSYSVNRCVFSDGKHGNTEMLGAFSDNLLLSVNWMIGLMKDYCDLLFDCFIPDGYIENTLIIEMIRYLSYSILKTLGAK